MDKGQLYRVLEPLNGVKIFNSRMELGRLGAFGGLINVVVVHSDAEVPKNF